MTTVTVTGFLVDGINYVGGEGTGWELQTDHVGNIEVDVSRVESEARKLRNQNVTITGHFTTVEHIERGPSEVLVAEEIRVASN